MELEQLVVYVCLILDAKLNATIGWFIKIQSLKLAVSPHFEINISVPVLRSPRVRRTCAQLSTAVLLTMIVITVSLLT
jgi:hypothetical protein